MSNTRIIRSLAFLLILVMASQVANAEDRFTKKEVSLYRRHHIDSIYAIRALVGKDVWAKSLDALSRLDEDTKRRACSIIVDYSSYYLMTNNVIRLAAFDSRSMKSLIRDMLFEAADVKPKKQEDLTGDETVKLKAAMEGLRELQRLREQLLNKGEFCLENDIVSISGFVFSSHYVDILTEFKLRDFYIGVKPIIEWVKGNIKPPRNEEAEIAIYEFEKMIRSMQIKYEFPSPS